MYSFCSRNKESLEGSNLTLEVESGLKQDVLALNGRESGLNLFRNVLNRAILNSSFLAWWVHDKTDNSNMVE
ncbi:MAG TPA: hypothetical protein DGG95_14415 [Cytophagales bacterium]|nr:hypothetical protein [Cytophagales bacterium]